jgi:predicted transcriptional regulator
MTDFKNLLFQLQALAHPARLWIVSYLADGRRAFVSQLAKEAGISRPLMKMHLIKLERAKLVKSAFEPAESGKVANFYQINPFVLSLDPKIIAQSGPYPRPGAYHAEGDADD